MLKLIPETWNGCNSLLCIRADNMGDVIMSTPAIRALKQTFGCGITVMTSKMGQHAVPFIREVDDLMVCDLPWAGHKKNNAAGLQHLVEEMSDRSFDGVVIFSVYSQSSLPAALLSLMAGIPRRLAFSRENPYSLLTDWMPDKEPYEFIQHQVQRDLQLVNSIGANPSSDFLHLEINDEDSYSLLNKLHMVGVNITRPIIIFHPGVSEEKRRYPADLWIETGNKISEENHYQIVITGTKNEQQLAGSIAAGIGVNATDIAGLLTTGEYIAMINMAEVLVSVNTAAIHIAAARQTPVVVLYANTNPQHTPWKVPSRVLPFSIPENLKSRNEIIRWVDKLLYSEDVPFPQPDAIVQAIHSLSAAG